MIADVLHLVPHDIGRRFDAFVHNISADGLGEKFNQVLESGDPCEEQVKANGETDFLMRLLPYRTTTVNAGVGWSPACYKILGYEPDEFPALHSEWMKRIHPDDRVRIQQSSLPSNEKCFVELHKSFDYLKN